MTPRRGDVWLVNLSPTVGREQAGTRPAVIISSDLFNESGAELVTVLPITSTERRYKTRIALRPPEGGVKKPCWIIGEQIRTISIRRLIECWGNVNPRTLDAVVNVIRFQIEGDEAG